MRFKGIVIIVVFLSAVLPGCNLGGNDKKGSCEFVVYSYGDGIDVMYRIDGKSCPSIKQDAPDGNTSYYVIDEAFELPTSISITANALSLKTSSIVIEIYQDEKMVKSNTVSKTDSAVMIVNSLKYDFGSTDTGSSSGDSTK